MHQHWHQRSLTKDIQRVDRPPLLEKWNKRWGLSERMDRARPKQNTQLILHPSLIDVEGGTSTACTDKDAVTVAGRDAYGSGWHIHLRD